MVSGFRQKNVLTQKKERFYYFCKTGYVIFFISCEFAIDLQIIIRRNFYSNINETMSKRDTLAVTSSFVTWSLLTHLLFSTPGQVNCYIRTQFSQKTLHHTIAR